MTKGAQALTPVSDAVPCRSGIRGTARLTRLALFLLGRLVALAAFLFLIGPLLVVVGSSFSPTDYLEFPPSGFSLRWYEVIFTDPDWLNAFRSTLTVTALAVPLSLVLGVLAAYALGRSGFRGKEWLSNLFMSPLMLPEVMIGTALLYYLSLTGLMNSVAALVIGHMVAVLPFVIRLVLVSVQSIDRNAEMAAAMLGASPLRVFVTVTVPLMRPGLFAATVFAVVLSIGELALTVFLVGPTTTTVPVMVYTKVLFGFDPTITAVSTLFAILAFPALVALDRWVGLEKVF